MKSNNRLCLALTVLFASMSAATAFAGVTDEDWIIFEDFVSGAECGVIHTSNAEFVALFDSGNMVIVSGADVRFDSLVVTSEDQVLFNGQPFGLIEFLEDGDELPTVFWTTLVGTMVEVDTLTGEPFDSGELPSTRINTFCDACDLIDGNPTCDDNGGDGDGDGDVFIPFPSICGLGSTASIMMTMFALPFLRLTRSRRIRA